MTRYIPSPLRYPGGKQKDIPLLAGILEQFERHNEIKEYREPFLGGGSMLLYSIANLSAKKYWGNDAYPLLIDFWQETQENVEELCELIKSLKEPYHGPTKRSQEWTEFRIKYFQKLNKLPNDRLHNAARFFILNRSTASGTTESGGMTPLAYCKRFTDSSIERLHNLKGYFNRNVKFTNLDYSKLLSGRKKGVFIFLDPPYLTAEKSALYGESGKLHKGFEHQLLAERLRKCPHNWLMTIDNSPEINELYSWANIISFYWKKPYSMTNINSNKSIKDSGKLELLISSFEIDPNELANKKPNTVSMVYQNINSEDLKYLDLANKKEILVSPS
ncbi:DNA adenine methylase [Synechocystis sp. B12]|nr:DNA adenine methylase [Synechocystis sp. B12]